MPFDVELNMWWILLISSFILIPVVLIIFNKFFIVFLQTLIIGSMSGFLTFLNLNDNTIQDNSTFQIIFYGLLIIYLALGLYSLLETIYRSFIEA